MRTAAIALIVLISVSHAQEYPVRPIFYPSIMSGMVGSTPTRLYLAPSPVMPLAVANFINEATNTLDVCVYELNHPDILDALLDAKKRGVKLRVIIHEAIHEDKSHDDVLGKYLRLKNAELLRVAKPGSRLMHNKFMVADNHAVWTGSYNFSVNDTEWNDNNAVSFSNRQMAENYTVEMQEIWDGRHGKRNFDPTPHPEIDMGEGVVARNLFAPEDDLESAIVEEIMKATNSVFIMAFALTDENIFNAITNRVQAGIKVLCLLDLTLSRHPSSLRDRLRTAGVNVRISSNNGRMHHKVMVIDDEILITGSANFSKSAFQSNDENIIIFACPPLARAFKLEFARSFYAQPYWVNKWSQPNDTVLQRLNQLIE